MKSNWKSFMVAAGFALICLSTTVANNYPTIISGIALVGLGWYLLKKDSKKSSRYIRKN